MLCCARQKLSAAEAGIRFIFITINLLYTPLNTLIVNWNCSIRSYLAIHRPSSKSSGNSMEVIEIEDIGEHSIPSGTAGTTGTATGTGSGTTGRLP